MTRKNIIIGSGPAATNACETIRQFDADASITLISDEPAHSRMALPYWLSGQIPREQTHTGDDDYFNRLGVTAILGQRVTKIDTSARTVSLSGGSDESFDRLLIATGSSPVGLPVPGIDLPHVQPLWTLAHTESLLHSASELEKPRVALVGAGFIGCIVLNAMFKRGWDLTVIERDQHVLPRMLEPTAAGHVERWLGKQGVHVKTGAGLQEIVAANDGSKDLVLNDGSRITADLVIVATGVQPNLGLIAGTDLETDFGILVDERMQTNVEGIYAAGDVAQGPAMYSDSQEVHAIQTTAVDHGRIAGANMAGHDVTYSGSLLMNVLDVCGLQCASFANWSNSNAEAFTINNESSSIYRNLVWTDDRITGASFVGQADDMGMLVDIGMVKGILQTQVSFGPWKDYLRENPFDIRRPFVALKVAERLTKTTLLGRPATSRGFHFGGPVRPSEPSPHHATYVASKLQ